MDLFDDLPEPEKNLSIPSDNIQACDNESPKFFSNASSSPSEVNIENKGAKRKLSEVYPTGIPNETIQFVLQSYFAEKRGEREEMQDFHVLLDDFHNHIPQLHSSISRVSYYAVFDGHGGARASQHAATYLHQNLAEKFPQGSLLLIEKDIRRILVEVFKKTDEDFLKIASKNKPSWKDGTTAIVVLVVQDILYIANLGDSKAILCRYNKESEKYAPIPLSVDHSPTDYQERMRIQKAGGYVREGRVMGIIEVSRSLGDGQYKALGITTIPDVKRCQISERDAFILLACDGLWKVFSSEEVLDIVLTSWKENSEDTSKSICYESACSQLVTEAIRKHSGDNVTVAIISIQKKD